MIPHQMSVNLTDEILKDLLFAGKSSYRLGLLSKLLLLLTKLMLQCLQMWVVIFYITIKPVLYRTVQGRLNLLKVVGEH